MHTIHYIAAVADSAREAAQKVDTHLSSLLPEDELLSWFDWYVIGGGRWASSESAQYDSLFLDDIVHKDDDEFFPTLKKAMDMQRGTFEEVKESYKKYVEEFGELDVSKLELSSRFQYSSNHMLLHYYSEINKLMWGEWYYGSHFLDLENRAADDRNIRDDLESDSPSNWYLVPVDFHF